MNKTNKELFTAGFFEAVRLFNAGLTLEKLSLMAQHEINMRRPVFAAGVDAGAWAMSGWLDSAERHARSEADMTRDEAQQLVDSVR